MSNIPRMLSPDRGQLRRGGSPGLQYAGGKPLSLKITSGHLSQSLSCTVNAEAASKPRLTIVENRRQTWAADGRAGCWAAAEAALHEHILLV